MTKRVCFYNCFPDELTKQIAKLEKDVEKILSVQYSSTLTAQELIIHFAWVSYEGETPEWVKEMKSERGKEA